MSQPEPDTLELACDKIWDQIEIVLTRHAELDALGERRTARETIEMGELWAGYQKMRAYSNYYREIVLRDAQQREGRELMPKVLTPRILR